MKNKILKIGAGLVIILFLVNTTSATLSPQSLNDLSNTAKDRYITATTKYQQTTNLYDTAKQDWLTAINRYQVSKNAQDLSVALDKANSYLIGVKDKLIYHINRVITYVEGVTNLGNTDKQYVVNELNSYKSWLEDRESIITVARNKTNLTNIAEIVKSKWQEIQQATRRIIGQIINSKILKLIEKAEILAAKIERMLQRLNEQGIETEALETWLVDFYEKIRLAKQKYQEARDKYASITNLRAANSYISEGKAYYLQAKRYLNYAYKILREIVEEVKKYRNREIRISGTGTLIAEGDGYASISGNGTIEVSGENCSLTVTDLKGDITISVTGFGEKVEIESNKWRYTGRGTASITGSKIIVEIEGINIHLTAKGSGSATLTGTGTFSIYKRLIDENSLCLTNNWTEDGATVSLSK